MFQWTYHTNTENSLPKAHSLQVTITQGIQVKASEAKASGLQGLGQSHNFCP